MMQHDAYVAQQEALNRLLDDQGLLPVEPSIEPEILSAMLVPLLKRPWAIYHTSGMDEAICAACGHLERAHFGEGCHGGPGLSPCKCAFFSPKTPIDG